MHAPELCLSAQLTYLYALLVCVYSCGVIMLERLACAQTIYMQPVAWNELTCQLCYAGHSKLHASACVGFARAHAYLLPSEHVYGSAEQLREFFYQCVCMDRHGATPPLTSPARSSE